MRPEDLELPPVEPVNPALVESIAASVRADLRPVRPLAPAGAIIAGLLAIFVAVATAGAAILGFFGLQHLGPFAIALIFPALGGLALLMSAAAANAMVPGSQRPLDPALLLAAACAAMAGIFILIFPDDIFPDDRAGSFVGQGVVCLRAGLIWAIPAGAASWLVLRHGYAVDGAAAGIAAGGFAGLAGLAILELHCPNFLLPHVLVWHIAVAPISALSGWAIYFFGSKRRARELMQ